MNRTTPHADQRPAHTKDRSETLAYLSDIKREVNAYITELIPLLTALEEPLTLLTAIRDNQLKLISMLTPMYGSITGRDADQPQ